jgi:GNAT superfamily N-acetyltransferase
MEVRTLLPPPWTPLAALVEESHAEGFRFLIRFEQEFQSGLVRFAGPVETLLGAFEDSALIGMAGLTRDPYSGDPRTGRLRHVYLLPGWRGRGIGKALIAEIEHRARAHFLTLVLRTDTPAAATFYRTLGYEQLAVKGTATHRRVLVKLDSLSS